MSFQHPLTAREYRLMVIYRACQFGMSPIEFYQKWNVTHAQMAQICGCSESTVDRWFLRGKSYRKPLPLYCRRLAEMDFLWEHHAEIPDHLWQQLCPQPLSSILADLDG